MTINWKLKTNLVNENKLQQYKTIQNLENDNILDNDK